MSAYRVPIVVAALVVIALGVPCKDGAAHDDTCGTAVDVDSTHYSSEFYLLQKSMNLAEVAPHEVAPAEVVPGGDVQIAALLNKTNGDNSPHGELRGDNAAVTQAGKLSARGSSDTAVLKPSEGATEGQGAGEGAAAPSEPSKGATEGQGKGAVAAPEASKGATEGQGADADAVADKGDAAEAIVLLARDVNDKCRLQRLLALAHSSSTGTRPRDVWFLHDKASPPANWTREVLANAGVSIEHQPEFPNSTGWESFGGSRSGPTKPSFLSFAMSHGQYEFFWFVEEDVLFTGKWSSLWDAPYQSNGTTFGSADLIGRILQQSCSWVWYSNCKVLGHDCCGPTGGRQFAWPVARFSKRYVRALVEALDATGPNSTYGHHEAVAATFCQLSPWCTMEELPVRHEIITGGWGNFLNASEMSLEHLLAQHPTLPVHIDEAYHPVKCEADSSAGRQALHYAGVAVDSAWQ